MDIVIVGGGYAGVACATRLARRAQAQRTPARIRLVSPSPVLVERIRLHQAAAGQHLPERRIDALLRQAGVELVTGCADAIDPDLRTLRVGGEQLRWDRLVLALGSQPQTDAVPGAAEHACTLDPGRLAQLRQRLGQMAPGGRVLVVGGGLTGIESACELAQAYPALRVRLVSGGPVAHDFSPHARAYMLGALSRLGVSVDENVPVRAVHAGHLECAAGELPFDLCLWAAGFRFPALPQEARLRVNAQGQVLVDPALRSVSHPAIYAAGDIAAPVLPPGQPLPLGCKSAMPAGAHAGDNLARELRGAPARAFDFALLFFCVSLGRRDGLVQSADAAGRLNGRILTGRRGAWFKEMICRSTWWALWWEARGWRAVVWKRTGRAPASLASGGALP